jgi:hypothetical protein
VWAIVQQVSFMFVELLSNSKQIRLEYLSTAVFPLQVLGFDVDFINSVQLSNHTGYPVVKVNYPIATILLKPSLFNWPSIL